MNMKGREVVWSPLPGSQTSFLACPVKECLYHGSRGGGKTDCLIMAFCQHVGKGYGEHWRGLIIREHFKNLEDVISKSKKWIPKIWPSAKFVGGNKPSWTWPTGEKLFFVHANKLSDYDNFHGHEYPAIFFEELTNWATPDLYLKMFSVCRSSGPREMPRIIRATTNPSGRGHGWVKERFINPAPSGTVITDSKTGAERVALASYWWENKYLTENDPDYIKSILANPEHLIQAWLYGNWDIIAGGMFDDVWKSDYNVVAPFTIPHSWRIDRGFDWGSGHPFSVLWFAESDGCDVHWDDGDWMPTRKGDVFVIAEWYGSQKDDDSKGLKMTAKEIARGIVEREKAMKLTNVQPGPADSEIWNVKGRTETIADDMEAEGAYFVKANKAPGSRVAGWDKMRKMIKAAWNDDEDECGLFVFETCRKFIAHVPVLPRDEKNLEDVDTDALDHESDCCFVSGTLITTERGKVPIEKLRDDDRVLTRDGFYGMVWHKKTRTEYTVEATLGDGTLLRGVGSHRVMTDKGWKELDTLSYGDIVITEHHNNTKESKQCQTMKSNLKSLTEKSITFGKEKGITAKALQADAKECTSLFGNLIMGLFQRIKLSTTKTATGMTIESETSSASHQKSIHSITAHTRHLSSEKKNSSFWKKSDHLPQSGTEATMEESGTHSMEKKYGETKEPSSSYVSTVSANTRQRQLEKQGSAQIIANQRIEESLDSIISPNHVTGAVRTLPEISISKQNVVRVVALRNTGVMEDVYNLCVDGPLPEYYANEVLVHNCRYRLNTKRSTINVESAKGTY